MTQAARTSVTHATSVGQWCSQNRHFLVVATVLTTVWLGWAAIRRAIGQVTHKEPVAWPAGVEVHPDEFRLLSLPEKFGPEGRFEIARDGELFAPQNGFLYVAKSGEVLEGRGGQLYNKATGKPFPIDLKGLTYKKNGKPVLDREPDGEKTIIGEVLESLAIGTPLDKSRHGVRKSTWYVSRVYIDRSKSPGQRYRSWQLDVTYYTGSLDKVPHVPERCLRAAGMSVAPGGQTVLQVTDAPGPWKGDVAFRYVPFEVPRREVKNLNVQYYVFSLNGWPQPSWKIVRATISSVFGKYAYFAKIQFGPAGEVRSLSEANEAAQEFARYMMPEVLKTLPMPEDIERLK